ncbi:MAG: carbamoyltransferase HypF [Candidatus Omnitrophica bacterium]|nr:carbamoyltransferase HypF [Candidatus Omnitrophota bacterium]
MEFKKIRVPFKVKEPVLALGAHVKNTVCFVEDNAAFLSSPQGNLDNLKDFLGFERAVKYFLKKSPAVISYDLHPEYQSSKYAVALSDHYPLLAVQHHHAHIVSCMAENNLRNEKVIGVAFDGTGLGLDNRLWGAEFLICDYGKFIRKAYLKEIPLLGQEMAIREPWRLAACWLYQIYKERFLNLQISLVKKIDRRKWQVLRKMYLGGINSSLASSMGRLFDAASSLILGKLRADFEAELAVELEKTGVRCQVPACQAGRSCVSYNFKIAKNKNGYILDPRPIFKQIVDDLKAKEPREKIAYRFHLTIAEMIKKTCIILRKDTKINKVALSGGVFQNNLLLSLVLDLLYKEDFVILQHKQLPNNDASLSFGQAVTAAFRTKLLV